MPRKPAAQAGFFDLEVSDREDPLVPLLRRMDELKPLVEELRGLERTLRDLVVYRSKGEPAGRFRVVGRWTLDYSRKTTAAVEVAVDDTVPAPE